MDVIALEAAVCEAPRQTGRGGFLEYFVARRGNGLILEFGVAEGGSINVIARVAAPDTVYGFDSWEGLPEPWDYAEGRTYGVGHLKCPKPASVRDNVILVEGLFQDTLEPFLSEHTGPAGFVHIDSDIYSSAAYVLAKLTPRLASGCILVFDELMPSNTAYYPNWRNHEWRALTEWLPTVPLELEPLAHNGAAGVAFRVS